MLRVYVHLHEANWVLAVGFRANWFQRQSVPHILFSDHRNRFITMFKHAHMFNLHTQVFNLAG